MTKFSCVKCGKSCRKNQKSILCDLCNRWMHCSCIGITCAKFDSLGISDEPFLCSKCCRNAFLFHNITNDEFNQLFTNVTLKENIISDISFISSCYFSLNDQYLSVKNFTSRFSNNNVYFISHINIRSLNKNIEKI